MLQISTAQWIAYLAPAVLVQAVGILFAVRVGRTGSQAATSSVAGQTPTIGERVLDRAA
jgi:hypothetical protein